jgi:hypothetical protein
MKCILLVLFGLFLKTISFGQVTISQPSLSINSCVTPTNYFLLGNITITETLDSDFSSTSISTIVINAPTNLEFEPNIGNVSHSPGKNISSSSISVSANQLVITYACNQSNKKDELQISNLRIRATTSLNCVLSRSGGTGIINGLSNGTSLTNSITATINQLVYRTISNVGGLLNWNDPNTWTCGIVPPNDGSADVFISAFQGIYNPTNAVFFQTSNIRSLTIESGANFSPPDDNGSTLTINGNFEIKSGAFFRQLNWIQSGKNTLTLKGDFINNGTMTTDGSSNKYNLDIILNGTSSQTISGNGIFRIIGGGNQISILTFSNEKGVNLNVNFSTQDNFGTSGAVVINDLLTFGSSTNQFTGSGSVTLNGHAVLKAATFNDHFANSGSKTLGSVSTLEYTNSNSNISSTNIPSMNLYRLVSSVGSNGTITVNGNLTISNRLSLNSGRISLGVNTLTIGTSLSNLGTISHTSGFIIGKVKRWFSATNSGNESGLFPLGISNKRKFVKVEYTQSTDGGTLTAEWIPTSMGSNFINEPISTTCNGSFEIYNMASGYWSMTPGDGITNAENKKYNITLFADGLLDFSDDCHVTALKRQGSNPWMQSGVHVDNSGDAISPNVQRVAATGWSNWGFAGGSGTPLPVELSSITLTCDENGSAINWTTQSEFNSKSFELEQSIDGFDWTLVSSIQAAGISNEEIDYQYYIQRSSQINYIRLRQVDINGDEKIYGPLVNDCSKGFELSTFPNPSENDFNILLRSNNSHENATIKISDINGRVIEERSISVQEGINLIHFTNTENLEKGTYFIQVSGIEKGVQQLKHIIK